jgi:hypothetical protein
VAQQAEPISLDRELSNEGQRRQVRSFFALQNQSLAGNAYGRKKRSGEALQLNLALVALLQRLNHPLSIQREKTPNIDYQNGAQQKRQGENNDDPRENPASGRRPLRLH